MKQSRATTNRHRAVRLTLPEFEEPTAREEVIEILAYGLCELVMRGCKPNQPREQRHPVFGGQARHRNSVGNRRPSQRATR